MFKSITTSRRYTNRTLVSLMPCVSPSRWPHVYFHYTNTASSIILHLNSSTLPWRNCSLWSVQFSTLFLPSRPFPSCWSRSYRLHCLTEADLGMYRTPQLITRSGTHSYTLCTMADRITSEQRFTMLVIEIRIYYVLRLCSLL